MSTTAEELKKLYKKLGGNEESIRSASTPGEILNGINELDFGPGGGSDLPPVTEDDNGKVLGVVESKWDKTYVEAHIDDDSISEEKLTSDFQEKINSKVSCDVSSSDPENLVFTAY